MAFDGSIQGKWLGRLIDVRGFEGEITINLKQNKKAGNISGTCVATIGTNHGSSAFEGEVKGGLTKYGLQLSVAAGKKGAVVIKLDGQTSALKEGGVGLKGTYIVSGRGFSPLRGGVICASLNKPITSVAIAPETAMKPTQTQSNDEPKKKRRRES